MPTVPVADLTHFCEAILEGAGVPRHKAGDRGRLPDLGQPARRRFPRHPAAAVLHRSAAGRRNGRADRWPGDFRKRQLPALRRAERARPMGGGDLLRATRCGSRASRALALVIAKRVEPFRRRRVVGAEDARRRTDRHRDVQRIADRAAMAGQEGPVGHQPHLHVGARAPGCWTWPPPPWRRARSSKRFSTGSRRFRRAGPSIPKACPPPTRRPPTRAC